MQKFLFPLIGIILGAIIAFFLSSTAVQAQQNCPLDWHPPPCGTPPKPVKPWLQQIAEEAERYHWKAAQIFGLWMAATCPGSTGHPGVDAARKAACMLGTFTGASALAMQQWEQRLIAEINAARDGGTQFVAVVPLLSYELDSGGDPWFDAFRDHIAVIENLGNNIVESVRWTLECDAWAQTDVRGIECGNAYRQWTEDNFYWMGERYLAVANITEMKAYELIPDIGMGVNEEMVNDLYDDAAWNRWAGWGYQQ